MNDIEQKAHDFALTVVSSYQQAQTHWSLENREMPCFEINKLIDIYFDTYEQMKEELLEEECEE